MKYLWPCLGALIVFFLFLSTPVWAETDRAHYPIGQLVALEGKAFYAAGETQSPMKLNDPVFMNTVVETGKNSKALIMFIDNTQITLGADSQVVIDEYVFDPYDSSENKGRFEMTKGAFLWVSGLLSKRENPDVGIKTKVGSIGIRGTKFWGGDVDENDYGIYVFEGLVNFTTQGGQTLLPKDHGVVTGGETAPLRTENWPAPQVDSAVQTITFRNAENVAARVAAVKQENIAKQHDYRGQMFPYKPNPLEPKLIDQKKDFFSKDFQNMLNK